MSYMRDPWYIFGSRDHMEFYKNIDADGWAVGIESGGVGGVGIPYEIVDQFVVMRYHDLAWYERQKLRWRASRSYGRPNPPFGPSNRWTRRLWFYVEWYLLGARNEDY